MTKLKLYKISAMFLGKHLHHEVVSGYIVAKNDEDVFEDLKNELNREEQTLFPEVERIRKEKGTCEFVYVGGFYDIKYKWEKVGKIKENEAKILEKFGVLRTGIAKWNKSSPQQFEGSK